MSVLSNMRDGGVAIAPGGLYIPSCCITKLRLLLRVATDPGYEQQARIRDYTKEELVRILSTA